MAETAPKETPPPRPFAWLMRPIEFALKWSLLGVSILLLLILAGRLGFQVEVNKLFGQDVSIKQVTAVVETNDEEIANLRDTVEKLREDLIVLAENADSPAPTALSGSQIRELPTEQGAVTKPILRSEQINGEGVIWLGRYENGTWSDATVDGLADLPSPDDLVDRTLTLRKTVNLRANFPAPVQDGYYEEVTTRGVVYPDTRVTILSTPRSYDRKSGTQYWAKVQTTFEPKATAPQF
ncbi:hypothetical protein [Actibacterium sp. 188UL27-1]|uniref:hypothetical protein n=1 Tax=Actibacterium sp. 188UL27-1 TaxID=2786961 RepID=UPI00195BD7B4|nr:hypothetical protein [Actibacterium sp. 188UL27-1]MBM7069964.1 hypothetical protein [Actibacterium sp. 188UL27-1]